MGAGQCEEAGEQVGMGKAGCWLFHCSCHLLFIKRYEEAEISFCGEERWIYALKQGGCFCSIINPLSPEFPHENGPRRMRLGNYFSRMYSVGDEFGKRGGGPSWY